MILTERGNYKNLVGYYSFYPAAHENLAYVPKGWEPTFALENAAKKRFEAKHVKDIKRWYYAETGFVKP